MRRKMKIQKGRKIAQFSFIKLCKKQSTKKEIYMSSNFLLTNYTTQHI